MNCSDAIDLDLPRQISGFSNQFLKVAMAALLSFPRLDILLKSSQQLLVN